MSHMKMNCERDSLLRRPKVHQDGLPVVRYDDIAATQGYREDVSNVHDTRKRNDIPTLA